MGLRRGNRGEGYNWLVAEVGSAKPPGGVEECVRTVGCIIELTEYGSGSRME